MTQFLKKFSVLFLLIILPYGVLTIQYFVTDPFRVKTYPPYLSGHHHINRGVTTTNGFLRAKGIQSIILGNSRSISIRCSDLIKMDSECEPCFHFDASAENLFGINQKAKLIRSHIEKIKTVVIVIDDESRKTHCHKPDQFPFVRHPIFEEKNWLQFNWVFLKQFLDFRYQWAYLNRNDHSQNHWISEFDYADTQFDPKSGDYITAKEKLISVDSVNFYAKNLAFNYKTSDSYYSFTAEEITLLEETVAILEEVSDRCIILFQPRHNRTHPSSSTLLELRNRMPHANIIDATHIEEILQNNGMWYEESHFRPIAGRKIIQFVQDEISK